MRRWCHGEAGANASFAKRSPTSFPKRAALNSSQRAFVWREKAGTDEEEAEPTRSLRDNENQTFFYDGIIVNSDIFFVICE